MKHWVSKLIALVSITAVLSGCIEERVIVKVKKDGSGFVEHYSYNSVEDAMGGFLSGMMEQQSGQAGKDAVDKKVNHDYNDEYFQEFARSMGQGVTVKDYQLGNNGAGMKGYHATYAFTDINQIAIKMREEAGKDDSKKDLASKQDALAQKPDFSMKDGVLSIKIPYEIDPDAGGSNELSDIESMPPQMLGMMAAMFQGMRIAITIEGLDPIKETNALHRVDNQVILTDAKIDTLMKDMESVKKMQNIGALPRSEMQAMANNTNGLDIDLQEEITIRF